MWRCKHCEWVGESPSVSDASHVRIDYEGNLIVDRVHIAVCPECFQAVRRHESTTTVFDITLEARL